MLRRLWMRLTGRAVVAPVARAPIPDEPPRTIEDVLATMRAIDAALPRTDGVAHFNRMYLAVTEEVHRAAQHLEFEDGPFVALLDAVFADLYFRAVVRFERERAQCPRAWIPLFESRGDRRIAPIQFALAGLNAHINRDLAIALVDTCARLDVKLERGSPQHRDYLVVNRLLAQAQEHVEPTLKRGILGILDRWLGRADETAQMWSLERARDAAWIQAETLWQLRATGLPTDDFLAALDRMVGLSARGLLVRRPF